MTALLQVEGVSKLFGGYLALSAVSCAVAEGAIHAVIGPNGAGKTTLFNIITGLMKPSSGRIRFRGEACEGLRADRVLRRGIARSFQQVRLFAGLSVLENAMIGAHARMKGGLLRDLLRLPFRPGAEETAARHQALALLDLVGLGAKGDTAPGELTLVDQRRLEIARALASRPHLLLLDEPAAGMNALEVRELGELIGRIRAAGTTVLMIEHNMRLVMTVAERITVLGAGRVIAEDTPATVRADPAVIAAYLGAEEP